MNILVSVDAEGLQGITFGNQVLPGMDDYNVAREIMAQSVNSVARGIRAGSSVEKVTVVDSHDGNRNILAESLDSGISLITGSPKPLSMVEGVRTADKLFLLGYHPKAGTMAGVLDHTYSTNVHRLKINGEEMGEIGLSASVSGHFGVPVTFLAGDRAAVEEGKKILEDAEFVVLKEGISRYASKTTVPVDAEQALEEAAIKASARKGSPFVIEGRIEVSVEFQNSGMAENCMMVPGTTRKDGYTVQVEAKDMVEAYSLFRVLVSLSSFDHGGY